MLSFCTHIMKVRGNQKMGGGGKGSLQSFWWGYAARTVKPILAFQTKICDFLYLISNLNENSIVQTTKISTRLYCMIIAHELAFIKNNI